MTKFEWLHPLSIGGTLLYALMGIIIFWAAFIIIDKITPYDLWREIVEKQNKAWAWWWLRCAWASASSWRRPSIERWGLSCRPARCGGLLLMSSSRPSVPVLLTPAPASAAPLRLLHASR